MKCNPETEIDPEVLIGISISPDPIDAFDTEDDLIVLRPRSTFGQPAQHEEDEPPGPAVQEDATENIGEMANEILTIMCSHPPLAVAPDRERLFAFATERVHERIATHLAEFVGEISDEIAHRHEAAPGSDAKADGGPTIGEIVEAIVRTMCSHPQLEVAPGEEELVAGVAERLHQVIWAHLGELVQEITEPHAQDDDGSSPDCEGDGPNIGGIVDAIVERMCSHPPLEVAPAQEELFAGVAERLHQVIWAHREQLVVEIRQEHVQEDAEGLHPDEGDSPNIAEIAQEIVSVMCSHSLVALADAPERHFAFVAERLHERIRFHLADLVKEILAESSSDLAQIVNAEKEAESERQRLANGPDDPIGPPCDGTDFECGATDSGPLFTEPGYETEDDFDHDDDHDVTQDHRTIIAPIAEAIIERMCSSAGVDVAPNQEGLFVFVAQRLADQIRPQLANLVTDICRDCADDITEILAEEEQVESPPQHPGNGPPPRDWQLAAARAGRKKKRDAMKILSLKHQLGGYKRQAERAKIASLTQQLASALESHSQASAILAAPDLIWLDLVRNRDRPPKARRYCIQTLVWARQILDISPSAWAAVRKVLPVPSDRLLYSKFFDQRAGLSEALFDEAKMDKVISVWEGANPRRPRPCPVVLACDAICFRPTVVVREDGKVEGLAHVKSLDTPDLFTQFLADPNAFMAFLKNHWKDAYSAFFAFQVQPLDPDLHCSLVHLLPRENGKGDDEIVAKLERLSKRLDEEFGFQVVAVAFDGDKAFNPLHAKYAAEWGARMPRGAWNVLDGPNCSEKSERIFAPSSSRAVAGDPLHLEKRVRYRMVSRREFSVAWSRRNGDVVQIQFSLDRIREAGICSPLVFANSKASKMHDSLPLGLFSVKTLGDILRTKKPPELLMVPWCLLNVSLTLPGLNTRSRAGFLEVGFWILCHCKYMKRHCDKRVGIVEVITGDNPTLYLAEQLDHALNTFHTLISLLRNSKIRICLNRVGSNPVEHLFGKGRIRCKDVHTMEKLAKAFVSDAFAQLAQGFLELLAAPRRRVSVGLDCEPWDESKESILKASPWEIAHAIVQVITEALQREIHGLMVIPGLDGSIFPVKPSSPISKEKKVTIRTLSSNQLFLGMCQTPRAAHMNALHGSMGFEMQVSAPEISAELTAIIKSLSPAALRKRVQYAAALLRLPPQTVRGQAADIAWLATHEAVALPLVRDYPELLRRSRFS
jgi:hypothetical protein